VPAAGGALDEEVEAGGVAMLAVQETREGATHGDAVEDVTSEQSGVEGLTSWQGTVLTIK
jgi:hypothetical protein